MVAPDPDQQTDPRADNHRRRIALGLPQRGLQMQTQRQLQSKPKAHPCGVGIARTTLCCELFQCVQSHEPAWSVRWPGNKITERTPRELGSGWVFRDSNETLR